MLSRTLAAARLVQRAKSSRFHSAPCLLQQTATEVANIASESPLNGYLATRTLAMPKDENMHVSGIKQRFEHQVTAKQWHASNTANEPSFQRDIFGGFIMSQMDAAAAIAAERHSKARVVTVAVDKLQFLQPVHTGDTISCYTWIKSVGRTSMNVRVLVVVKSVRPKPEVRHVTEGTFTMVATDENGKPTRVPPLD